MLSYLPLAHIVERAGVEGNAVTWAPGISFSPRESTASSNRPAAAPVPPLFLSVPRLLLKFQQGVFPRFPKRRLDRLLRIPAVNLFVKRKILRGLGLDTVHHAACGAAPLPPEILVWYRNLGLDLAEGYGMTETMITHLPRTGIRAARFCWARTRGSGNQGQPEGELLVRSPMNMLGYYRDPETTRAAFTGDGFFRTGDVVAIEPDGQLKIIGRIKEQFKTSKGKYVAPAPIEGRLMENPAVGKPAA